MNKAEIVLRIIWTYILLLISPTIFGQVDSLFDLANKSHIDSVRLSYLHEAAQLIHTDTSLVILHRCLKEAKSVSNAYWVAKVHQTLGKKTNQIHGEIDSLLFYSKRSRDQFEALNIPVEAGRSLMQIGIGEMSRGNREVAMAHLTEAAQIFETEHVHSILAPVYINISSIYRQSSDLSSEFLFLTKAYEITKTSNDLRNLAIACMGIQSNFASRDLLDSATTYAKQALKISEQLEDPILLRYSALNLGKLELKKGNIEAAEGYYLKQLTKNLGKHDRSRILYWIGCFYHDTKQYDKADTFFERAANVAISIGANEILMNTYIPWSNVLKHLNQYEKAYHVSNKYILLSDSLHNSEVRTNINELTIKYESEKKERENQALLAENKENELKIFKLNSRLKQQILMAVLSILGLVSVLLYYFYNRRNQKQKEEIARQQVALQSQRIKDLETEQMLLSIKSLVRGQEEERGRIAKELHDGLGSMMSSLKLAISKLFAFGERLDYQNHVQHTMNLSEQANGELRRIAQNLMPETLTKFGLIAALEDFIAEINFTKTIHIDFQYMYHEEDVPSDLSLSIYRIIQELLNNTIKHAKASEVLVQLMKHDDRINITVEDNGVGFDVNRIIPGNGMENIKSRLAFFGGEVRYESTKEGGTAVFIECNVSETIRTRNELSE